MKSITIKVNAKINLSLDVTGVRANGYHDLDMLMTSVDIYDVLIAKKSDVNKVVMDGRDVGWDNTALKTLDLLHKQFGIAMQMEIEKGIPFSAGMGGSSADASGVLYCANKLYGIEMERLLPIALKVGCDVPYMLYGGGARVQGVGEIITPVELPQMTLVVAQKVVGSSTKDIYSKYDEVGGSRDGEHFNVLERGAVLLNSEIAMAREDLKKFSKSVFMTGSGSAYVGIFDNDIQAKKCEASLHGYAFCSVAHTMPSGIEIVKVEDD